MRQVEIPCCGAAWEEGQRMMKSSRATGDFIFFHFFMQSLQQSSLPDGLGPLSLSLIWLDLESWYLISFWKELFLSWPPQLAQLVVTIFFGKRLCYLKMLNWDLLSLGLSFDKRADEWSRFAGASSFPHCQCVAPAWYQRGRGRGEIHSTRTNTYSTSHTAWRTNTLCT